MKAVVLREPRKLEWTETPEPRMAAAHDVLIKVDACGICGSDLRYWEGENPWALHTLGRHVPNPPNIILGHEYAGVVAAVNAPEYERLLGKRVGVQAYRTCGECEFCRTGAENLCRKTIHMGHAQGWGRMDCYPGAYAEYCLGWGDLLYPLPDHVSSEEAAMADVLCVAVHVVGRAARLGEDALCIGGGPVGLSIAQVAKAKGVRRVFVSEPSPIAKQVLRCFDFITVIDPGEESLRDGLARHGVAGVSAVFDTIGSGELMAEAAELLAERGTYVNVAVHDTPVALNAAVLGSERTLTSSSNAVYADVREAYELICSGRVNVKPMITHRLPLSEYATAFDLLLRSPKEAFKVVLRPNGRE
jgi:2-desacetyl-2-hydroxyethyl bacteriochlorophyllide A dehydrogenase